MFNLLYFTNEDVACTSIMKYEIETCFKLVNEDVAQEEFSFMCFI